MEPPPRTGAHRVRSSDPHEKPALEHLNAVRYKPAMRRLSFSLPALILLATSAQGASPQAIGEDFRAYAQDLPSRALSTGYRSFGHLDLSNFLGELQSLNVRVGKSVAHKQRMGGFNVERDGAQWDRNARSITVNGTRWPKTRASAKPMLAFHEALGATGYSDDNFGCSASIWALTDNRVRSTLSREELAHFERNAQGSCVMAGGSSTGVTGGGDDYNVVIRMNAVEQYLGEMQRAGSQAERSNAFRTMNNLVYQGWGINRRAPLFKVNEMGRVTRLERTPDPSTIRVYADLELTQLVPQNAKNGWTYDARQNAIIMHGRYIPKMEGGMMIGPIVRCTYID